MKKIFKSGFTLVEMLIVMGILGILLAILSQVFGAILSLRLKSEAKSALAQDSRYLLTRLAYDVGRAEDLAVTSPTSLDLVINSVTYTYALQDGSLLLTVGGDPAETLNSRGTRVTSLALTALSPLGNLDSLRLDFTLEATTSQPGITSQSRRLITTLGTR